MSTENEAPNERRQSTSLLLYGAGAGSLAAIIGVMSMVFAPKEWVRDNYKDKVAVEKLEKRVEGDYAEWKRIQENNLARMAHFEKNGDRTWALLLQICDNGAETPREKLDCDRAARAADSDNKKE